LTSRRERLVDYGLSLLSFGLFVVLTSLCFMLWFSGVENFGASIYGQLLFVYLFVGVSSYVLGGVLALFASD
jgi:drug/metabolite transporter (DMT)-like permease